MTTASPSAKKWTCSECGVSAGRIDGGPIPLPGNWASSADGHCCLVCRRERAADAALASVPSDSPREARAQVRRAALIEFEVRRTPDLPNGKIASACRSSVSVVAKTRTRLGLPEAPQAAAGAPPSRRKIARR